MYPEVNSESLVDSAGTWLKLRIQPESLSHRYRSWYASLLSCFLSFCSSHLASSLIYPPFCLHDCQSFQFRDVGGLPTQTGTVRRNRLFRSAQPGQITPEGAESLRQLGITMMFDLRSTVEISNYDFTQAKDMNEIQRVSVPIFTNSDTSQQISRRRNYALGQPVTISFSLPPPPYPSTIHTAILKS